jgi:hypothetical protein
MKGSQAELGPEKSLRGFKREEVKLVVKLVVANAKPDENPEPVREK